MRQVDIPYFVLFIAQGIGFFFCGGSFPFDGSTIRQLPFLCFQYSAGVDSTLWNLNCLLAGAGFLDTDQHS